MTKTRFVLAALGFSVFAGFAGVSPARAAITFTFADPATGPEITYTEGTDNTTDPGLAIWTGAPVSLQIDGSADGLGAAAFNAQVLMSLQIGAVTDQQGGTFIAPILSGAFSFVDTASGMTILSAALGSNAGAVLTLGTTGDILAQGTGASGELVFTAGAALDSFLNGATLSPAFDASFTLTAINPAAAINNAGFLQSFAANSAFTGSANTIPTPGALALAAISVLTFASTRKRHDNTTTSASAAH